MNTRWDAVVIGAGPAGMSAAYTMAKQGLQVVLIDEQSGPGGQIFRNITHPDAAQYYNNARTFDRGNTLTQQFLNSSVVYMPNTTVWMLEPGRVFCVRHEKAFELKTLNIVVATGAMERPVPFTGWTLPRVMLAGAADALLKGGGKIPQGPIVLAGSGPLMLVTAVHALDAGAKLEAIVDMTSTVNWVRSLPWLPQALLNTPLLLDGARMLLRIKRSGVPIYCNARQLAAHGTEHVEAVSFIPSSKKTEIRIDAQHLLFHAGMIPRTHMARVLRLPHTWDNRQQCWTARYDIFGTSHRPDIYIAGDCARVLGEKAAALRGELAGLKIAYSFFALTKKEFRREALYRYARLLRHLAPRNYIDACFAPRGDLFDVPDDVIVCRCENIRAGDIREAAIEGMADVNEVKLRTRAGMGLCQGRTCGAATAAIAAAARGIPVQDMGALSIRNPVRAIPLEHLIHLKDPTAGEQLCR